MMPRTKFVKTMEAVVKTLAIATILVSFSIATKAQDWHPVASSFCSQIKAKGAEVSGRPLTIFEAPSADSKCCEGLNLRTKEKTERFGHFRVLGLDRGHYFLSFDLKTKQVIVPILVDRLVDKRFFGSRDCDPTSRITVEKGTDKLKWEEWITVD